MKNRCIVCHPYLDIDKETGEQKLVCPKCGDEIVLVKSNKGFSNWGLEYI